jgi:hypothetical protein
MSDVTKRDYRRAVSVITSEKVVLGAKPLEYTKFFLGGEVLLLPLICQKACCLSAIANLTERADEKILNFWQFYGSILGWRQSYGSSPGNITVPMTESNISSIACSHVATSHKW